MNEKEFKDRTKKLALRFIRLVEALPNTRTADVICKQLLRSGTSVGANYRAACRGKSRADVISKLGNVEEEADESLYWMELILEARMMPPSRLRDLAQETEEILAMTVASIKTLRTHNGKNPQSIRRENENTGEATRIQDAAGRYSMRILNGLPNISPQKPAPKRRSMMRSAKSRFKSKIQNPKSKIRSSRWTG